MDLPTVFVLDGDASACRDVAKAIQPLGVRIQESSVGGAFLAKHDLDAHACLILDELLADMQGLEVLQILRRRQSPLPVIMTGSSARASTVVAALRNGALDFLEKPLDTTLLLERVRSALQLGEDDRQSRAIHERLTTCLALLSPRERDVLAGLMAAWNTKQIAARLGVKAKTVDNHRAHILKKFDVSSTIELMRMLLEDKLQSRVITDP